MINRLPRRPRAFRGRHDTPHAWALPTSVDGEEEHPAACPPPRAGSAVWAVMHWVPEGPWAAVAVQEPGQACPVHVGFAPQPDVEVNAVAVGWAATGAQTLPARETEPGLYEVWVDVSTVSLPRAWAAASAAAHARAELIEALVGIAELARGKRGGR
jgi:hypothetical protein